MKLQIQPLVALCDTKLDIGLSGLPPSGKVKISASMRLPWAKDVLYESAAWFTADAGGNLDLSKQKPDHGSYDFIDSMGLIVSMKSKDPKAVEKIIRNISVDENIYIDIQADCGQDRESATVERWFKKPEVRSQRIADGFVGELFHTDSPKNKTIVWLAGSGGGLGVNALVCAPLASHGFNVLSLPYFGEKGLPTQLSRVPLEYFEKAFDWLAKNPITAGKEIQVLGMSKGAELALILASRLPFITRMVLWAPHAYCFQGIAYKNESSWTYAGPDLPYIRLRNSWVYANMLGGFIKNEPFEFASVYKKGVEAAQNREEACIKVEDMQADVLLITSKQCGMWNTYDGSLQIMDTLRKSHYSHAYDLIVYEDAGEPYLVPYVIPAGETDMKFAPRLVLRMGGTLAGNAHARADAWEQALAFFKR